MRKIKSTIVNLLIITAAFSIIVTANPVQISNDSYQEVEYTKNGGSPLAYAQISFNIFEGSGCGCVPLIGTSVSAYGLDTDHSDSGITDENGLCILELEYDATYRVTIDDENFVKVTFDFLVIDDQTFTFRMQDKEDSISQSFPVLSQFLQKLIEIENI